MTSTTKGGIIPFVNTRGFGTIKNRTSTFTMSHPSSQGQSSLKGESFIPKHSESIKEIPS